MLHRNDITYTPHSPLNRLCCVFRGQRAKFTVTSYQLPVCALSFCRYPCHLPVSPSAARYIQIHGDGRQVALHVSNDARLISGGAKLCGRGWRIQTTCNNFVQKFFSSPVWPLRFPSLPFPSLFSFLLSIVVTICVFCLRTFWHYFSATAARTYTKPCLMSPPPPYLTPWQDHANKFKYALCARRLNKFGRPSFSSSEWLGHLQLPSSFVHRPPPPTPPQPHHHHHHHPSAGEEYSIRQVPVQVSLSSLSYFFVAAVKFIWNRIKFTLLRGGDSPAQPSPAQPCTPPWPFPFDANEAI